MRRRQIFVDSATGAELVLPVSPPSFQWEHGINVETINIDGLGDVNLAGHKALDNRPVECFFPAQDYPFNEPGTVLRPYYYVERIEKWIAAKKPLRYIVAGTPLNASVLLQSIKYEEKDGTGDVYATITLREHRAVAVVWQPAAGTATAAMGEGRLADTAATAGRTYTVRSGDTLSAIARKFYGDGTLSAKLAAANGIANPNLIYTGQVLTLPAVSKLPAAKAPSRSQKVAAATKVTFSDTVGKFEFKIELEMKSPLKAVAKGEARRTW